jgi:methylated-DNA-[protein]-cysteine S-methyltransferase
MSPESRQIVFYDTIASPLGVLYVIFSGKYLSGISFSKPSGITYKIGSAPPSFKEELLLYFQGADSRFKQGIKFLEGTEFEKKVWAALKKIPFGETRSYKWVAERIGSPAATRAVGRALSKNPVPIVVPCHRVIESDGSIGGFSSGVDRKIRLLEMEYYAKMNKK